MKLEVFPNEFSVCKIPSGTPLPDGICFFARTDNENSLVCETRHLPELTDACESDWRMFRVSGILDFSLIGILARIASLLADAGISIFCVSTYDTDYILIKASKFEEALNVLLSAGYDTENI